MTQEVERSVVRAVPDESYHGVVRVIPSAPAAILRRARRDEHWLAIVEDWTERASAPSGSSWRHDSLVDAYGDDR